jgi:hypothetical protein
MSSVVRLLTFVDISDRDDPGPDARSFSVSARHEAVLDDGRSVVLLDDRGWFSRFSADKPIWPTVTVEHMERTARQVVGPDEPFEGWTYAEMEKWHWDSLAGVLRQAGIKIDGTELSQLRHDVELSDRVLARIGGAEAAAPIEM